MLAYLDPAAGSLVLQLIVSGLIGGVAFLVRPVWKLLSRLSRQRRFPDKPN